MFRLFICAATLALAVFQGCDSSPPELLGPISTDTQAIISDLSEGEKACISDNVDADLTLLLSGGLEFDSAEVNAFYRCLEHETVLRSLLTPGLLDQTGTLSAESSECIRDGLQSTDLLALILATGSSSSEEANAALGRVTAASILALSCLNDEEFEAVGSDIAIDCVLNELGGTRGLKALVQSDSGGGNLFQAMFECGVRSGY